jgi:hypothetical protein
MELNFRSKISLGIEKQFAVQKEYSSKCTRPALKIEKILRKLAIQVEMVLGEDKMPRRV